MKLFFRTLMLAMLLLSNGCVTLQSTQGSSQAAKPDYNSQPYEWPPYQSVTRHFPSLNPAAQALMREADEHYAAKAFDAAGAALERALRIAPREAVIWYRLAGLRASQGDLNAANRFSEKASSLLRAEDSNALRQWLQQLSDWLVYQLR